MSILNQRVEQHMHNYMPTLKIHFFLFNFQDSVTSSDLPLLIRIVRKKWYPKLAQRRNMAPSCDEAVDNVLLALSEAKNANTIQDICQEFKNIERLARFSNN